MIAFDCSTRHAATETVRIAGCVISVRLKLVFRTFKAQLRKFVAESGVGFVEGFVRDGIHGGKFLAHADGLRTLSGKEKCDGRRV